MMNIQVLQQTAAAMMVSGKFQVAQRGCGC
jgi:hypothetical protein